MELDTLYKFLEKKNRSKNTNLLILYGDNPLIDIDDLKKIKSQLKINDVVIMGFHTQHNNSYGIIIEKNNKVEEIVEFK